MTTDAQKRASAKYHAKKMSDPEYREKWNKRFVAITIKKYKDDETFKTKKLEYQFWKYYYDDAEDKAIKAIRRLF
jgi:hypothetical protein